jgi:hypothetical protein
MEKEDLGCSWSEVYIIDQNSHVVSGDCSRWEKFSRATLGNRTTAFSHSTVVKKNAFLECGIMKYEDTWSPCFEDLFYLFMHSMSGKKCQGAKFYWRNHSMNMTNTLLGSPEWKEETEKHREIGEYTGEEVASDHSAVSKSVQDDLMEIINKYNV